MLQMTSLLQNTLIQACTEGLYRPVQTVCTGIHMYIDAATKVLYRTPVQNWPQAVLLQLVCNSRSVQKLLYRSCCTEAPVQNVCTASYSRLKSCTERLYRTPVQTRLYRTACTERLYTISVQRFSVLLFI